MQNNKYMKRIIVILLLFTMVLGYAVPPTVNAEEKEHKVVRVGWFDSSFCNFDQFGRRGGIDYEYQQKISAYTGWTYEYVEGSWSNLFQMLKEGKIDLLSDVSYKPEREEYMYFSDLPMGTESYYILVALDNREITSEDISSIDGKRIGVNKGSIQESFLKEWAEKNRVKIEVVPLVVQEDESMRMVTNGELDGYASIYTYDSKEKIMPIFRIGGSDYYYAVNKKRPDLLTELNVALANIQDEDPYFNQKISEERLYNSKTNALLTPNQEDWVKEHGAIRIGYRENYIPFCQKDENTGELTGALKDYIIHAQNILDNPDKAEMLADNAMKITKIANPDAVFKAWESYGLKITGE